jgi:uncharacterized protein YkwD
MNYKIATEIVNIWKNSTGHNEILSDKKFKYIGTSTVLETKSANVKNWLNVTVFSTLVMTN